MAGGGSTVGRTVRRSRRGEGHAPLPSSTATDPGTGISPPPGSRHRSLHRSSTPARNSNSGACSCYAAVLSRVPVAVIAAWWTTLRRTSGDLKDLDKLGIDLVTWLAGIALAPPRSIGDTGAHGSPQPTGCGCGLYLVPFPHFSQQGWLVQPSPNTLSPFGPTSYCLIGDHS